MNNSTPTRPAIPEPDYDDPKELYAFFGLAAYCIQLLEQGLLNLLVGLQLSGNQTPVWADAGMLYDEGDRKTLGQLLKAVHEIVPFEATLDGHVQEALRKRNYLTHHFFVEHDEDLLSHRRRREMIDELRESIRFFKMIDSQVDALWHAIWGKYGFTQDRIEAEAAALKERIRTPEEGT
jgi:hypothetical protein